MKLRVGDTTVGTITKRDVERGGGIRRPLVNDLIVEGIVSLLKRYQHVQCTDNVLAKEKFLRALGIGGQKGRLGCLTTRR